MNLNREGNFTAPVRQHWLLLEVIKVNVWYKCKCNYKYEYEYRLLLLESQENREHSALSLKLRFSPPPMLISLATTVLNFKDSFS